MLNSILDVIAKLCSTKFFDALLLIANAISKIVGFQEKKYDDKKKDEKKQEIKKSNSDLRDKCDNGSLLDLLK